MRALVREQYSYRDIIIERETETETDRETQRKRETPILRALVREQFTSVRENKVPGPPPLDARR